MAGIIPDKGTTEWYRFWERAKTWKYIPYTEEGITKFFEGLRKGYEDQKEVRLYQGETGELYTRSVEQSDAKSNS